MTSLNELRNRQLRSTSLDLVLLVGVEPTDEEFPTLSQSVLDVLNRGGTVDQGLELLNEQL